LYILDAEVSTETTLLGSSDIIVNLNSEIIKTDLIKSFEELNLQSDAISEWSLVKSDLTNKDIVIISTPKSVPSNFQSIFFYCNYIIDKELTIF